MVGRWEWPNLRNARGRLRGHLIVAETIVRQGAVYSECVWLFYRFHFGPLFKNALCLNAGTSCTRQLCDLTYSNAFSSLCLHQVCHHPDCLDLNNKSPLHLCESCDSRCHSENTDNMHFDRHPRFDLQPQGRLSVFPYLLCFAISPLTVMSCLLPHHRISLWGFIFVSVRQFICKTSSYFHVSSEILMVFDYLMHENLQEYLNYHFEYCYRVGSSKK